MKNTKFLLTLNVALLTALAFTGCTKKTASSDVSSETATSETVSSVEEKEPIEVFVDSMKDVTNFTAAFEDAYGYVSGTAYEYKSTADAAIIDYSDSYTETYESTDKGYLLSPNKGIYSIATDDDGKYVVDSIFSKATTISLSEIYGSPTFIYDLGDEVWNDGKTEGTYTTKNGEAVAKICAFAELDSYSTYCEYVNLSFDDPSNIKAATFTMHFDESSYYDGAEPFDLSYTIKEVGTTTISGLDDLKKAAAEDKGLTGGWTTAQVASMTEQAGCTLPANTFDYASYAYEDADGTFNFCDLSSGNVADKYGAELEKLGFVKNELNSSVYDDDYTYYYEKFIMDGTTYVGVYTVGVYYISSATYAYYGELYPSFFPNGTFQVAASHTTYMTKANFYSFFETQTYGTKDATIAAPSFTEDPVKIVFTDNDESALYWGLNNWYVLEGTFSTHDVALENLNSYVDALKASGWVDQGETEEEITTFEDDDMVQLKIEIAEDDYIFLSIVTDSKTGGFQFDIEY